MGESDRVVVKTYVPQHQKDRWASEADALGMSQSEFIRTMVQAGRSDLDVEGLATEFAEADPRGTGLEERVIEALSAHGPLDWAELRELIVEETESDLEATLERLQETNEIQHSGRAGGYTLQDQ